MPPNYPIMDDNTEIRWDDMILNDNWKKNKLELPHLWVMAGLSIFSIALALYGVVLLVEQGIRI